MIDDIIDEASSIMDSLRIFEFNDDVIDAISRNRQPDDDSFISLIDEISQNSNQLEQLIEVMGKLRENENQDALWDKISSEDKSPTAFQPLCYGLMEKAGKPKQLGVILYVSLLSLHPINLIWNRMIFDNVLSIMISASQAIENPKQFGPEENQCIQITSKVFHYLSLALTDTFCELAQNEVMIALIELAVKMLTIYQKELDPYSQKLTPSALDFLNAAAQSNIDYIMPFLVLSLLLDFLPNGKSITNRIIQIRTIFLEFCQKHLSSQPEKMILLLKHIFVRSSDRVAIKENSAFCIHYLMCTLEDPLPLIAFILTAAQSQKAAFRSLALDIFTLLINDEDSHLSDDIEMQMLETMKIGIKDSNPSVRSSSINSITSLISKADQRIIDAIINDDDNELLLIIESRVRDEKLNVRKATLKLLQALGYISDDPIKVIFPLIAERTRDRSVTMRQEAANILTKFMTELSYPSELVKIWFDSILQLALDTDTRTQELALKLIDTTFLKEIKSEIGISMATCLSDVYIHLLIRVFNVFKHKAINLNTFCVNLQKQLSTVCDPILWKLADAVMGIVPNHFKGTFKDLWEDRDQLPTEYLLILSKLPKCDQNIIDDSLSYIQKVCSKTDTDEITFARIHAYIRILLSNKDVPEYNIEEFISQIVTKLATEIYSSNLSTQDQLVQLIPSIFIIGELIPFLKNVYNFDFTGLQILIGEKLPNGLVIPSRVRAAATISTGKLCLGRRDITNSFVAVFAHVLHNSTDSAVKCNSLIVLCDLCVKYTATVDSYVNDMSGCFADPSPAVRHQVLLIMTRLIAEDYVKMRPLLLFRYIYSIVDKNENVAKFAQSCLFDVLNAKDPKLLSQHFIDALFYFNDQRDRSTDNEDAESHALFRIKTKQERMRAFQMIITKMSNPTIFELLQASCVRVLQLYLDEAINLEDGESLLVDTLEVMQSFEDQMEAVNISEATIDDPKSEQIVEQSRNYMTLIHNYLIKRVLPILNQMHQFLREKKSPLQSNLRKFFRKLCMKHSSLLEELRRQEPILAAELEHDISMTQTPEIPIPLSPIRTPFRSPLLSKIAKTPQRTTVALSGSQSPISIFSQFNPNQSDDEDEPGSSQKRPPVPFSLDALE